MGSGWLADFTTFGALVGLLTGIFTLLVHWRRGSTHLAPANSCTRPNQHVHH